MRFSLSESELAQAAAAPAGAARRCSSCCADGSRYPVHGPAQLRRHRRSTRGSARCSCAPSSPTRSCSCCPGSSCACRSQAGEREDVFLVPQAAVMQTASRAASCGSSTPRARPRRGRCRSASWIGADWMVLGGLAAGDQVIVDNLLKLRPGAAVRADGRRRAAGARPRPPAGRTRRRRRAEVKPPPCRSSSSSGRSSPRVIVDHHRAGRADRGAGAADRAVSARSRRRRSRSPRPIPAPVGRDARARPSPRRSRSSSPASRTCSTSTRARRRTAR